MSTPLDRMTERLLCEKEYVDLQYFHSKQKHTYQTIDYHDSRQVVIQGKKMLNMVSALYLSISHEPTLLEAYKNSIQYWGAHAGSSRIVYKTRLEKMLEEEVTALLGTEDCLFYQTTGLVSMGVLPTLCKTKDDVIIFDEFAHRTIQKSVRLASAYGVNCHKIKHDDIVGLETLLKKYSGTSGNIIIAVDGIYSMSGNHNDLCTMDMLARKYNAVLYVDDSHGFGIMADGKGVVHHLNISMDNMLYIASFQKTFGGYGSFVATNKKLGDYLRHMSHAYIFCGPPPVGGIGFSLKGLQYLKEAGKTKREELLDISKYAINSLREIGYSIDNETNFPIVCPVIGNIDITIEMANVFWEKDILVLPVSYPAVPKDKSLFRLTPNSATQKEDIDRVLDVFESYYKLIRQ